MSKENKSIQEKTDELQGLVAWFDSDKFKLEQAIDMFESAKTLAADIEHDLETLKNEITIIKKDFSEKT